MKETIAKKWIKALRSDQYKQGKRLLCNSNNQFCCLGVLTELFIQDKHKNTKTGKYKYGWTASKLYGFNYYRGGERCLSHDVMKWSGMKTDIGVFTENGVEYCLANINDNGKTFKHIANKIEKHFEEL
jgi:hypothetical protein